MVCSAQRLSATANLAAVCNDTARCEYPINYKLLGDPQKGCATEYEAEYRGSRGGVRH